MNAKKILAVWSFMLIAIFLMGCQQVDQVVTPDDSLQKTLDATTEIPGVIYMIWAEKLAHDVYTTLGTTYNSEYPVFSKIADTEQQHMNSLIAMLVNNSNETDPTKIVTVIDGETIIEEVPFPTDFLDLYNNYIVLKLADGSEVVDPLAVGIDIEKILMKSYTDVVSVVTHPGLTKLYENLLAGSSNHLAAFDPTYTP